MKKFIVIALSALVSACACFDCADENENSIAYQATSRDKTLDCDYFDGKTCYRYVYKNIQRQVAKPEPVHYRPCGAPVVPTAQHTPCGCKNRAERLAPAPIPAPIPAPAPRVAVPAPQVAAPAQDNCCQDKVSETREPYELVYKKVTTRTTYEPKTSSQVSYEKVPYNSATVAKPEPVEVVTPSVTTKTIIEEVK